MFVPIIRKSPIFVSKIVFPYSSRVLDPVIKNFLDNSPPDLHRTTFFSYVIDNGEFNNLTELIDHILKNTKNMQLEKFYRELIKFFSNTILPYLP
jgi:hypothetical protein